MGYHLQPDGVYSNPSGMLYSEANTMEGCGGQAVTAPDRGYEAAQWGASGEVEMEYDRATGVAYKVWVKAGYLGSMSFMGPTSSGTASYVITPTSLTLDGEPVAFDWTSLEAVTPTVTAISNAWINYELGAAADKDCRASGDCEVVLDDGHGHSTFTLQPSATTAGGSYPGITVVFAQGSSTPVEIETVNPGGKK